MPYSLIAIAIGIWSAVKFDLGSRAPVLLKSAATGTLVVSVICIFWLGHLLLGLLLLAAQVVFISLYLAWENARH